MILRISHDRAQEGYLKDPMRFLHCIEMQIWSLKQFYRAVKLKYFADKGTDFI